MIITTILLATAALALATDTMKVFPPPEDGMVRFVLELPPQADESAFRVELIVGKIVQIDKDNSYFLTGKLMAETISGWGYTRYIIYHLGSLAGTLMAVDSNSPKVERFIALGGEPFLIRYNSRLPVVVYAPAGAEVRYRVWSAGAEMTAMQK